VTILKYLLSLNGITPARVDIDIKDSRSQGTALYWSCGFGQLRTASFLIGAGANPLLLDKDGLSCLALASRWAQLDVVQMLIAHSPSLLTIPTLARAGGKYPIHHVARWGHDRLLTWYITNHPITIQQVDGEGNTPLHEAARWSRLSTVQLLCDTITVQSERLRTNAAGLTPLQLACTAEIRALIERSNPPPST
jgi:ankyrin repeat protein